MGILCFIRYFVWFVKRGRDSCCIFLNSRNLFNGVADSFFTAIPSKSSRLTPLFCIVSVSAWSRNDNVRANALPCLSGCLQQAPEPLHSVRKPFLNSNVYCPKFFTVFLPEISTNFSDTTGGNVSFPLKTFAFGAHTAPRRHTTWRLFLE